ncbi:MAG: hypothetical protein Q8916_04315 [Bacteroidota bacterium]|nr:hypothetical protein [Bacteroidota bacterium]MDP4235848.1 hypothetical protein [Bacteroidota bacterium]
MNTELLQFLDGTLAPDREAELLHRLSVSPERRELLRSYFKQQELFQRDRNSIAVPYAAEQKLWAQLGEMMPPVMQNAAAPSAAILESAATTSRTGLFSSAFSVASVAVICLLIGLGAGFFAGKNSNSSNAIAENGMARSTALTPTAQMPAAIAGNTESNSATTQTLRNSSAKHHSPFNAAHLTSMQNSGAPLVSEISAEASSNVANGDLEVSNAKPEPVNAFADISSVTPKLIAQPKDLASIGEQDRFHALTPFDREESNPQKSFIQKWEFYFNEGIGKQFPNNSATNVSMPVVTNSSVSALFQPFANETSFISKVWGGATFGTANVTMKKFRIAQKDALDPKKGYEMVADLVHVQTTYGGALLQYRIPAWKKLALTITGTAAGSSAGMILGGEIGAHYDATSDVGISVGLRGTHLSYNIDAEQQQVIAQGVSSFGIPAATQTTQPSYNFEINSGIYFHF